MSRLKALGLLLALLLCGALVGCGGDDDPSGPTPPSGTNTALFNGPWGVATDGTNLYVADTFNHTVRKIVAATGVTTTLAGSPGLEGSADGTGSAARFIQPRGITLLGGQLYVTDSVNNTIRRVDPASGAVTTLAGTAGVAGGDDGTGAAASFHYPCAIADDGVDLYVADTYASTVRKVTTGGVVTTVAGLLHAHGYADGIGENARFRHPSGIEAAGGSLYVSDSGNYVIRRIDLATSTVTTWAGSAGDAGYNDGTAGAARFDQLYGLCVVGTDMYVADAYAYTLRRAALATAAVVTVAGTGGEWGAVDGTGASVRFNLPMDAAVIGGDLYLTDCNNHTIRKVVAASGTVTTLVGTAGTSGSTD